LAVCLKKNKFIICNIQNLKGILLKIGKNSRERPIFEVLFNT